VEPPPPPPWLQTRLAELRTRAQHWWPWLRAPIANFIGDDGTVYAAGIAFYGLVSLIPLGVCMVAVMGMILAHQQGQEEAEQHEYIRDLVTAARRFIPLLPEERAMDILHALVRQRGDLGLIGAIGLVGAATQVVDALRRATARLFGTGRYAAVTDPAMQVWRRGLLGAWTLIYTRLKNFTVVMALGFLVGGLRLFLAFLASLAQVLPESVVQLVLETPAVAFTLSQAIGFFFCFTGYVMLVFHLARKTTTWRARSIGGLLFALLLALAELVYANYVVRFSNMSLTYGSLASLVAVALWIFYSSCVFLICAQVTAVISNPARLHLNQRV